MGKTWRTVMGLVLAALFAASAAMMLRSHLEALASASETAEAKRLGKLPPAVTAPPEASAPPDASPAPTPTPEELEAQYISGLLALDLGALREKNGDVLGWIEIPGTELSYPLVQGADNYYYLTHTWKKGYNAGGAIYLDAAADPALGDFHSIIYGHRMNNDSMFGTLKYYAAQDYLEAHPSVYVALADGVYRYEVYAAFEASVTGLVYQRDLAGREAELATLAQDSSMVGVGVVPGEHDRLLTLSTCTAYGNRATRWVVQCRLAHTWPQP